VWHFTKAGSSIWPGMAITGLVFVLGCAVHYIHGVWSFNDQYITGIKFMGLPLEEILFFLTVPFSCMFIYACLNYYVKWQMSNGAYPKAYQTCLSGYQWRCLL
jgi:lycopene cyclase domain-containing protein